MRKTHNGSPGLYTAPNAELTPPGSLAVAQGIVIKRPGLMEKRRPYRQIAIDSDFASGNELDDVRDYNGNLYAVDQSDGMYYRAGLNGGGAFSRLSGSTAAKGFALARAIEMNKVLLDGTYKIDSDGGTPYACGIESCPDPIVTLAASGSVLPTLMLAGYRVVFGLLDAKNNLILGPPSGRVLANNSTGGTVNPQLKILIPASIAGAANATSYFYQVYRTALGTVAGVDPGDEMQLVYQSYISAGDASSGYASMTDLQPDSNKGAALYTNASQDGIAQANYQPPASQLAAAFKGAAFYGNCTSKSLARLQMLGIPPQWVISGVTHGLPIAGRATVFFSGSPDLSGIDNTMKLAITGTTHYDGTAAIVSVDNAAKSIVITSAVVSDDGPAGSAMSGRLVVNAVSYYPIYAAENIASHYFTVATGGEREQNVADTCASLIRIVNQAGSAVSAFYSSGPDDGAGEILFQEAGSIGVNRISIDCYGFDFAHTRFAPALAILNGSTIVQKTINPPLDATPGRVFYSKQGEPEHVPLDNYLDIGSGLAAVLALVPLRDSLLVFKEDGLFRISGDGAGSWFVSPFDLTVRLVGGLAASIGIATLANKAYAVTTKGILAIGDTGIAVISDAVANKVRVFTDSVSTVTIAQAAASERDALVYFGLGATSGGQFQAQGLIYCPATNAWTESEPYATGGAGEFALTDSFMWMRSFRAANGLLYRWTVDNPGNLYQEAFVDASDTAAWGTFTAGSPLPADRQMVSLTSVNAGAKTIAVSAIANGYGGLAVRSFVGAVFVANDGGLWKVTTDSAPTGTSKTLTLAALLGTGTFAFTVSARTLMYVPWTVQLEWVPYTAGEDAELKRFTELAVLLDPLSTASALTLSAYTEVAGAATLASITAANTPGPLTSCRSTVPPNMQQARRLSVRLTETEACQYLFVRSISYEFDKLDDSHGGG